MTPAERIEACRAAIQADIAELDRATKAADRPRATRDSPNPRQGRVWKALEALQESIDALMQAEKDSKQ